MAHAVDQLFAQWAGPDSPGASIAIIQNGKIVYSQGYGAANLEYGVPKGPSINK
jgi:CubicO group peptidase (beta-lactamase class C family)